MIELKIDSEAERLTRGLDGTSRAVQQALKRAVRKLTLWLRRQILRELSAKAGVTQKAMRQYRRVYIDIAGMEATLWVGLNPMPLHETGRVSWSRRSAGARVRGVTYGGAFAGSVYSRERKVWIRSSRNRQEGHPTYHPRRKYKASGDDLNAGRFPVELLGAPLEDAVDELDHRLARQAERRFSQLLEQELNFALNYER